MKKYSVLTYNFGGFEKMYEIPKEAISSDAEYIYVTDNPKLKSKTWKVVYIKDLQGDNFNKTLQIRYNPFKYVNTNIVLKLDGNIAITGDITKIIETFVNENYDAAVLVHPHHQTVYEEYQEWINKRDYKVEQSVKCMQFFNKYFGYNVFNYKGIYQTGIQIQKNDKFNDAWNYITFDIVKKLASEENGVERIDQIINSVVLNSVFAYKKIMPISCEIVNGSNSIISLYGHNSNNKYDWINIQQAYLFNMPVTPINFK